MRKCYQNYVTKEEKKKEERESQDSKPQNLHENEEVY